MNRKLENLKKYVSENKVTLLKKGAVILGAAVGMIIVAVLVRNEMALEEDETPEYIPSDEEQAALDEFLAKAPQETA